MTEYCAVIGPHSTVRQVGSLYGKSPDHFPFCGMASGLRDYRHCTYGWDCAISSRAVGMLAFIIPTNLKWNTQSCIRDGMYSDIRAHKWNFLALGGWENLFTCSWQWGLCPDVCRTVWGVPYCPSCPVNWYNVMVNVQYPKIPWDWCWQSWTTLYLKKKSVINGI